MQHFVVVGAGQAGATLVARLRADGFDGKITLIGAEPVHPYQRPPLSKAYMLGEMELSRLLLRAPEWYAENNIDLLLDTRVVGVNAEAKTITLQGEVEMGYDELAICTGSHPRTLPTAIGGTLDGVYTVRDLKDADTMAPEFTAGRKLWSSGAGISASKPPPLPQRRAARSRSLKWRRAFCGVWPAPKPPTTSATSTPNTVLRSSKVLVSIIWWAPTA